MTDTKKQLMTILLIVVLVVGIPTFTTCSANCVSRSLNLDLPLDGGCFFAFHLFVQIAVALSILFVLPLAGYLPVRERLLTASEFYWLLFRPPRFSL